jgi:RNA polymerase sigma-70 factor (ECF subfamily)
MRSIRRLLRNRCDAEDALQETFLSVFIHLKSFQGRSSVSTWMTRVAVNAALSQLRKSRGTAVSIDEGGEEIGLALSSVLQDGALDAERRLIRAQREELLAKAIAQLPPSVRSVLELRIRDEYSGKQIAEKMGISESAVKSRLGRAYLLLRDGQYFRAHALPRPAAPRVACLRSENEQDIADRNPDNEPSIYQAKSVQAPQSRSVQFLSCHTATE